VNAFFLDFLHSVFGEIEHDYMDRQIDWAAVSPDRSCAAADMAAMPLARSMGLGQLKLCRIEEDIYCAYSDLILERRFRSISVGTDMMRLRVCLSGRSWQSSHAVMASGIGPHCAIVVIPPGVELDCEWEGGVRHTALTLYVKPSLLWEFTDGDSATGCLEEIRTSQTRESKAWIVPLSYDVMKVCGELTHAPFGGSLLRTYQSAKARELICMLLSAFGAAEDGEAPFKLSARDRNTTYMARQLIIDTVGKPLSIAELARRVGVNRNKLMRNFKLTFGETIWDFHTRIRMNYASTLLLSGEQSILQVSERLGYSHQASFTTAFKRHFGRCPRSLRT
jgi:AraC-like DNA-binding protein